MRSVSIMVIIIDLQFLCNFYAKSKNAQTMYGMDSFLLSSHILISQGVGEERYLKDGTAKIIVEMAKREWPQNWTNMVEEITQCAQLGVSMEL